MTLAATAVAPVTAATPIQGARGGGEGGAGRTLLVLGERLVGGGVGVRDGGGGGGGSVRRAATSTTGFEGTTTGTAAGAAGGTATGALCPFWRDASTTSARSAPSPWRVAAAGFSSGGGGSGESIGALRLEASSSQSSDTTAAAESRTKFVSAWRCTATAYRPCRIAG